MKEDRRLPLNCASNKVWKNLRELRDDVSRLHDKMRKSGEDGDWLGPLLERIDDVFYPGSEELSSSGHDMAQVPVIPASRKYQSMEHLL